MINPQRLPEILIAVIIIAALFAVQYLVIRRAVRHELAQHNRPTVGLSSTTAAER